MVDVSRAFEVDEGVVSNGALLLDSIFSSVNSTKPTYAGDNLSEVEFYNSHTQINANRIAKVTLTYSSDLVTVESWIIYAPDGVTTSRTIIVNYSYTLDAITKVEVTES